MGKEYTIALAGNPNSGKTTMFNALTGSRQHVGNWPGVTVERKSGKMRVGEDVLDIVDLPGAYSLTAYTDEELVARNFLIDNRPHAVLNVLNAGALERNLYLTVQFLELGIPSVLVLNMMDEVKKQGKTIDTGKLSELLDCPVAEAIARRGIGTNEAVEKTISFADNRTGEWTPLAISYGPDLDPVIADMEKIITAAGFLTDTVPARWTALKYLEGDPEIRRKGTAVNSTLSDKMERMTDKASKHITETLQTSPEAIIADYRYGFIAGLVRQVVKRRDEAFRLDVSDRMDRVLTHRLAGPLIMFGIIYAIYRITFTVGEIPMGWVEAFFGLLGDTATALIPEGLTRSLVVSGIIDGVGGVMGFVPLIMIMFLMIAALEDSGYMARMAYMLDRVFKIFGLHGNSVLPFIVSGGIAGGCAVPGVMACRTLRSPKEKLATMVTAPFMTCGAKVPVFLMLAGAFFPDDAARVMFMVTIGAWVAALLVSLLLRSTVIKGEPTPFVMELPPYRLPTLKGVLIHTWERSWEYIKKAGTVILGVSILLWAAMTFPNLPQDRQEAFNIERSSIEAAIAEEGTGSASAEKLAELHDALAEIDYREEKAALDHTIAGRVSNFIHGATKYAGFNKQTNIALFGGFAAKEVIVSTLGTAYSLGEVDAEEARPLSERLAADPTFTTLSAVSLIIFVMLYAPCFVTIVAMAREAGWKWALFALTFNTILAYAVSVAVYQVGTALSV